MTAYYYAQLDGVRVVAVTQTAGEVDHPSMIPIASLRTDILGWRWTGTDFVDDLPPPPPGPPDSLLLGVRLLIGEKITGDELDDATVADLAGLYDPWRVGEAVKVGDLRSWDGTVVECLQAHTTQADWTPNLVPALWRVHRAPGLAPWIANAAYTVGERCTYQGSTYQCLQSHTSQVGWEPPNAPALWSVVTP